MLAKYPEEVEAQLDLALMIMGGFSVKDKRPRTAGTTEAVAILRSLREKAPDHPGVHHYIIHGFEGSSFAEDAWPSCEKYVQLVANIPHALHMPGHVYSQTGRWQDAAKSFNDAAINERKWMKLDKFYGDGHHGHNVHYLATAYSFEGRYDDAVEASRELLGYKENPGQAAQADLFTGAHAQGWFGMLRTQVQFQKWDALLDDSASKAERRLTYTEPPYYPRPVAEAMGEEALKNNKPEVARKAFKIALDQYPADSHAQSGLRAAIQMEQTILAMR